MPCYTFAYGDETHTVDLEALPEGGWRASVDGRSYTFAATLLPDGGWQLVSDQARSIAYAAAQRDRRYVWIDGAHYALTLAKPSARGRDSASGSTGRLTAQMPGQVRAVMVTAGDVVTRGQTLVILEAMKMELRVSAPGDGVVRKVYVQTGAVVERDAPLIDFEP